MGVVEGGGRSAHLGSLELLLGVEGRDGLEQLRDGGEVHLLELARQQEAHDGAQLRSLELAAARLARRHEAHVAVHEGHRPPGDTRVQAKVSAEIVDELDHTRAVSYQLDGAYRRELPGGRIESILLPLRKHAAQTTL